MTIDFDLDKAVSFTLRPQDDEEKTLEEIFFGGFDLHTRLFLLEQYHSEVYDDICSAFKEIFPFVSKLGNTTLQDLHPKRRDPGFVPASFIQEEDSDVRIAIHDISSGMKKVLLILTDLFSFPSGGVYLLDEYENSLGNNAINFLPEYLSERTDEIQFVITSHHPYLINQISPESWYVFNRKGTTVKVMDGKRSKTRYSASKQQRFVQLLNDPFYSKGQV